VHIANGFGLATRVRVDIVRGLARQFNVEGVKDMFVSTFSFRLVLRITKNTIRNLTR
jgi:hypothetical protein